MSLCQTLNVSEDEQWEVRHSPVRAKQLQVFDGRFFLLFNFYFINCHYPSFYRGPLHAEQVFSSLTLFKSRQNGDVIVSRDIWTLLNMYRLLKFHDLFVQPQHCDLIISNRVHVRIWHVESKYGRSRCFEFLTQNRLALKCCRTTYACIGHFTYAVAIQMPTLNHVSVSRINEMNAVIIGVCLLRRRLLYK